MLSPEEEYICPLTKEKCNKKKCNWAIEADYEDGDQECAIYHIVKLLVQHDNKLYRIEKTLENKQ